MVNEVGKEITIRRHQLSFYSATVDEFYNTAQPTRLRSTNLINFWAARRVVLIVRNVEIKARFFRVGKLYRVAKQTCDL